MLLCTGGVAAASGRTGLIIFGTADKMNMFFFQDPEIPESVYQISVALLLIGTSVAVAGLPIMIIGSGRMRKVGNLTGLKFSENKELAINAAVTYSHEINRFIPAVSMTERF